MSNKANLQGTKTYPHIQFQDNTTTPDHMHHRNFVTITYIFPRDIPGFDIVELFTRTVSVNFNFQMLNQSLLFNLI